MNIKNKQVHNTILVFLAEPSPCTLVTNVATEKDVLWLSSHYNMEFNEAIKDIQIVESDVDIHYVQLKFI